MRKKKVVLTYPLNPDIVREELGKVATLVLVKNRRELLVEAGDAEGLVTLLSDRVDPELLERAPFLRVVGNVAVGVNNIDLVACRRRGIRVFNTPRVLTRATAELTLALLLAAARRFPEGEALCRSGRFRGWTPDLLLGLELRGRRACLVGPGRIGQETARLFRALGIQVEWIRRAESERSIERKLRQAQILSLHCPLTPDTHHWLSERRLSLLPRDAIVLNTTRGPVVDEKALARALKAGLIFSAGLDVFEHEPKILPALCREKRAVLVPHIGSATREARSEMIRLATRGVARILSGKRPPWNQVV